MGLFICISTVHLFSLYFYPGNRSHHASEYNEYTRDIAEHNEYMRDTAEYNEYMRDTAEYNEYMRDTAEYNEYMRGTLLNIII